MRKSLDTPPPANSSTSHRSSALASMITRAARQGLKRLNTAADLHRLAEQVTQLPASKIQRYKHHHHYNNRDANVTSAPPTPRGSYGSHNSRRYYRLRRSDQDVDDKESHYLLTTDENEADRIHFKHDLIKLAFDEEFTLPIDFGQMTVGGHVLDIGCGTGDWCTDLAKEYPGIHVTGVDIAASMLPDAPTCIPPNCEFKTLNILTGLRRHFTRASLDCVHIRLMCLAFTYEEYKFVVSECWELLKPEGYLILMEMDTLVCSTGPITAKLNHDVINAAENRGLRPRMARELGDLIPAEAVTKTEKYRSLPIGLWGGRLGVLFREDLLNGLKQSWEAVKAYNAAHNTMSVDANTFHTHLNSAQRELEQYHSYSNFHYAIAQKPARSINTMPQR